MTTESAYSKQDRSQGRSQGRMWGRGRSNRRFLSSEKLADAGFDFRPRLAETHAARGD